MSFMPWDPFIDLRALRERIDRLFEESMRHSTRREAEPSTTWAPMVDIYENDDAIVVELELAGLKRKDIGVELAGDTLTVRGERKAAPRGEFLRQERPAGPFLRAFTLGVPVDSQEVKANYENGILRVTLPKTESAGPKQVEIDVE
mgnify:CR=1 FL=1